MARYRAIGYYRLECTLLGSAKVATLLHDDDSGDLRWVNPDAATAEQVVRRGDHMRESPVDSRLRHAVERTLAGGAASALIAAPAAMLLAAFAPPLVTAAGTLAAAGLAYLTLQRFWPWLSAAPTPRFVPAPVRGFGR